MMENLMLGVQIIEVCTFINRGGNTLSVRLSFRRQHRLQKIRNRWSNPSLVLLRRSRPHPTLIVPIVHENHHHTGPKLRLQTLRLRRIY